MNATEYRAWWERNSDVPYGYCWCGCGEKTNPAPFNNKNRLWVKGEPTRFRQSHSARVYLARRSAELAATLNPPNPTGLCLCGCGEKTKIARKNDRHHGYVAGKPRAYVNGHNRPVTRGGRARYVVTDWGYETPCWAWQRYINPTGYGIITYDGITKSAHRHYFELHRGPVPEGLCLDHLCHNRACVNPDHLEPVTLAENTRRGKHVKLSMGTAKLIRALHTEHGLTAAELGRLFDVSHQTIRGVLLNHRWRDVAYT